MQPLPLAEWDESLQRVVDDMNGRPLNVHSLMANHPALLDAWWDFRNYSVQGGELSQRDCELVILRVAVHMKSWYEWGSHVDRGLAAGLSQEEIDRVIDGPDARGWTERDATLIAAVDELVDDRGISASTLGNLSSHFSSKQVMDIIAIHGMYITLGCMINTWDLALDEHIRSRLPEGTSREEFEARIHSSGR